MSERSATTENIGLIQNDSSLPEKVVDRLRAMIISGELPPGTKLLSEPEFAKTLNISRSTLRIALDRLTLEGFIVRRRGVGTFVAQEPLVVNNLNINHGVTDIIRSIGAEPGTADLNLSVEMADHHAAQVLQVDVETPLVRIERIRTADEIKVVYSYELIPEYLFKDANPSLGLREIKSYLQEKQSVYQLIHEMLGLDIHHAIARLRPVTAEKSMAEKLEVPEGSGLLYIEQIDSTADGTAVDLAIEYHVAEAFTFTVYRS